VSRARILIVEDEQDIRDLLALHLGREGYQVDEARDGEEGLRKAQAGAYDLLILDWMLPGASGLDLTRAFRKAGNHPPILMVTARIEPADIVLGLEAGADDYVTKPFEIPVLTARVRALLRRASSAAPGNRLQLGGLTVNPDSYEATLDGVPLSLTRYEFRLIAALIENRGRVLTRERLIDLVQGSEVSVVDRAIDTHVFGLRKKLGAQGNLIETVRGVGYRVREP
jgi:two-component system, OmpR family, phosphate regulon response regulator PhoB